MTKRLLFTVFFYLFLAATTYAQTFLGFRAGGSISNTPLTLNQAFLTTRPLNSLSIQLSVEIPLTNYLSLQSGPQFLQEGMLLAILLQDNKQETFANSISYLKLPTLLKLNLGIKDYTIFGALGSYTSYGLQLYDDWNKERPSFETHHLSRWDYGGLVEAGLEKKVGPKAKITFAILYSFGLKDIGQLADDSIYNSSYAFTMGISLPLRATQKQLENR